MKARGGGSLTSSRFLLLDDEQRTRIMLISVYSILAAISAFMTVVNIFTHKHKLMLSTLIFAVANLANLFLSMRGEKLRRASSILFSFETAALLVFFIVSGEPDGFSAIWTCTLPPVALLIYGKKRGSILCAVELAIMIFFFYTPLGRSLLQYDYTESFLLRFPMMYIAFFAVSFLLEAIQAANYDALQESRRQYQYLYSHDALTDLYNRYGFNDHMDELFRVPRMHGVALLILDVDFFKNVNDRYGHPGGDVVLKEIALLLTEKSGENAAVCRWGGEEFAVIFTDAGDCGHIAEAILLGIRELAVPIGGENVRITASIGMVAAPAGVPVELSALVTQTDRCLYKAKECGRDRIVSAAYIPQS